MIRLQCRVFAISKGPAEMDRGCPSLHRLRQTKDGLQSLLQSFGPQPATTADGWERKSDASMRLTAVLRNLRVTHDQAVHDLARCRRPVSGSFVGPRTPGRGCEFASAQGS